MLVIGFFRDLFQNFGGLITFVTEKNQFLSDWLGYDTNIISLVSVGLIGVLGVTLALHLAHLINVIAG